MSLQKDVKDKLLANNDDLSRLTVDFVLEIDEGKVSYSKLKSELLEDIREMVFEEIEEGGE